MADYQLSYTGDQVNTAIGQIVNKNITGTLTIETLDLTNSLAITQGGATTAAAAREAILENKALSIAEGGTGATTAANARTNLGLKNATTETLLWTNASPTSLFAAQTISISNISSYDYFVVVHMQSMNDSISRLDSDVLLKSIGTRMKNCLSSSGILDSSTISNRGAGGTRYATIGTSGITFTDANRLVVSSSVFSTLIDNSICKPYKIYGGKWVA